MKKFKFRLEALQKLRDFKEKKLKIELGEILKEINAVEDRLTEIANEVEEGYRSQEQVLEDNTDGRLVKFYPIYFQGKSVDRAENIEKLELLRIKYVNKMEELKKARGESKVVEKLKEKDFKKFQRERDRKLQMELEETFQMMKLAQGEK